MDLIKKLEDNNIIHESYENNQIIIINDDCEKIMELMEDNSIDLVLTDPPYGIDIAKTGKIGGGVCKAKDYGSKDWDSFIPEKEVFNLIKKISINQIIFGGNYFTDNLKPSKSWLFWDKGQTAPTYADGELAWVNKGFGVKKYTYTWNGMIQQDMKNKEERFHPTQKPIGLFKMIIEDYSKENDLIFDGFAGSFTTALACLNTNRRCIAVEKDKDYYNIGIKRIEKKLQSPNLFGGY